MIMQSKYVSKRAKMVFDYAVRLKGSYNIQGSSKPMDSGDYICRVIGGGIDAWCFASIQVPDVVDADKLTFAGRLDKTKKGKPAVTLGSLIEITVDGEVVWSAKPVVRLGEDEEDGPVVSDHFEHKEAGKSNGTATTTQSTGNTTQTPAPKATRV
jgi:hypothetical protein